MKFSSLPQEEEMSIKVENLNEVKGISQNFSSPYTPEQNGVAKRRNITLIEAARTMLNSANLPKQFWGEAVNTTCYTQNRSIIVKRHGKTAYDMFRGRSPNIIHFHVFGCLVSIHNHKDHQGKFDEKADDGFFLGYSLVAKSFRVFNIRRQEMKETNHVTFSEDDEAISQSSTKGNNKHLPYILTYDPLSSNNINIPESHTLTDCAQDSVSPEEQPKPSHANNLQVLSEPDYIESSDNLEPTEVQVSIINEQINEAIPTPSIPSKSTNPLLEGIRIFLAYAAYMGFMMYQMDVKSAFLNGKISEEVYLDKALYGLKQAPRAWYETLSKFLIQHKFVRGFQIKQDFKGISICQEKYVKDLFKKYVLADSASVKCPLLPPNNLGPDESGVSVNETMYQANPKESHLVAVKRIFKYLKGTPNLGLCAKKQSSVAMSSVEAEYVAFAGCYAQVLWIKSQLGNYDVLYDKVPIFCDNTSAIAISNNPVLHSMTKHIDIGYHFIRDHILKGDIELHFVPTDLQLADIFTKPLAEPSFTRLVAELGFRPLTFTRSGEEAIATFGLADEKKPEIISVDLAHSCPLKVRYFLPTWKVLMVYIVKCLGGNQGSHDQLNINQQMIAYALCWGLDIDIVGILFTDLLTKLTSRGKKGREKNICYVKYLSLVMKHLLGEAYVNENLQPMKPYQITNTTFKASSISKIPLTSYMRKVAKPKTKNDKKLRKKKIPSSSGSKVSPTVRVQTPTPQASESQPAEETKVTAGFIMPNIDTKNSRLFQDMPI
ncbi:retrovirus-related pol polyprotein from transposon TNT 1-94 [Tanacetum coccineum]